MLTEKQRLCIINRHRKRLLRHGYSHRTLAWSSRDIQQVRFKVLAQAGIKNGDAILDVGCGFGDFKSWLGRSSIAVHYYGLDLSPDLLKIAQQHHPAGSFHCGEIFDLNLATQSYDWVVLSGTLNGTIGNDSENHRHNLNNGKGGSHHNGKSYSDNYTYKTIQRMYTLCHTGIAFNLLSRHNHKAPVCQLSGLQSYDPDEILKYCKNMSPHCELITDYLQNDFTIYVYK